MTKHLHPKKAYTLVKLLVAGWLLGSFVAAAIAGEADTETWSPPLVRLEIRRHTAEDPSSTAEALPGGIRLGNASIHQLLNLASPACEGRLDVRVPVVAGAYDVTATSAGANTNAWRLALKSGVESIFGLRLREEVREQAVLLLRCPAGRTPRFPGARNADISRDSPTGFSASSTDMRLLADNLGLRMGIPVMDETGLKGRFRIDLHWERPDREAIRRAVTNQLGLEFVEARRRLITLVVEAPATLR